MARRVIRISIYSLLGCIALTLIIMVALYHRTPSWYQPTRYPQEALSEATGDWFGLVSDLNKAANFRPKGEPVTFTFSQEQLNKYLQALPLADPQAKLPDDLADPMIVLNPDRLILAGRMRQFKDRPVSLHLSMRIVSDDRLAIVVESVQVGSLPLPKQFVRDQLDELRQRLVPPAPEPGTTKQPSPRAQDSFSDLAGGLGRSFFGAMDDQPMECVLVSREKHRLRLAKVELGAGRMTLTFVPLDEPLRDEPP